MPVQKITPFLWFENQAAEAMDFYVSIFKNSRVLEVNRMGPDGPVMSVSFELEGQPFIALNAGPEFHFTEAISFFVDCRDQQEVDELWSRLTADGGAESRCGWLKDKFGLSWQIIPQALTTYLSDPNPVKANAATQAMLQMGKIEVDQLKQAYDQA